MKKALSLLMLTCIACLGLSGCVDNKTDVYITPIIAGTCEATGSDFEYVPLVTCNPASMGLTHAAVQFRNYITGETPWSSSGGGTGTTFETTLPNPGSVYVKKSVLKCKSIDGESSPCDDTDEIIHNMNIPVSGNGGGLCTPILFDFNVIYGQWPVPEESKVEVEYYVEYEGPGNISDRTASEYLTFIFTPNGFDCALTVDDLRGEDDEDDKTDQEPVT